jgi:uncharacterized protein YjhX (UPF0386 family)
VALDLIFLSLFFLIPERDLFPFSKTSKEVMEDPCVASDGYTYDRKSIELWLRLHDKSPITSSKLPNTYLIPNHSLRSAILDWKSSRTHKRSPS